MMNIRQPKTVQSAARELLSRAGQKRQILLVYCGILLAANLLTTGLDLGLSAMMSRSGGLGNLGTRSLLSTFQTLLPLANTLVLLVLDLGLLAAMLRISREQFTSPQTLRTGLARFFPMLRLTLLQIPIYLILGIAASYIGMVIYFVSPLFQSAVDYLTPLMTTGADAQQMLNALLADEAALNGFLQTLIPMYVLVLVLYLAMMIPVSYRLCMAKLVILDDPRAGAFRAVAESFKMTRRNCMALFKLDLSFWWYYLLTVLVSALSMAEVFLPMSEAMAWGSYAAALLLQAGIYYFFRPKLEVSRCLIYNAIRPKPQQNGVVLGNIFQM